MQKLQWGRVLPTIACNANYLGLDFSVSVRTTMIVALGSNDAQALA